MLFWAPKVHSKQPLIQMSSHHNLLKKDFLSFITWWSATWE